MAAPHLCILYTKPRRVTINIMVQSPLEVNTFLDLRKEEIGEVPKEEGGK
jgi:hypothetical protein